MMKISARKYLLVFVCLFSILERTGIANGLLIDAPKHQAAWQHHQDSDDDSAEPNQTKEVDLKEYWAITHSSFSLPLLAVCRQITYHQERSSNHLGWILPVPTPPPNRV
jgi:hypothetical protein